VAATRNVQKFALIFGVVYAVIGILAFVPGLNQPPPADAPALDASPLYAYLLGIFPTNALHNLMRLILGGLGVLASTAVSRATGYSRMVAGIFAMLTIMGMLPDLNTGLGLIPIFGADVALHAVTAIVAAYFGWFAEVCSPASRAEASHRGMSD
jgi:Domain of unknown function (DUF4383)